MYYLSKIYLAVAYVTDKYFIDSTEKLSDIDNISWFNYKKAIEEVIDFNVNLAKKPIDLVGDIYSKGKGLVNKQQMRRSSHGLKFILGMKANLVLGEIDR